MTANTNFIDLNLANENIDLTSEPIVKVQIMESELDEELRVKLEGPSINNAVVNAIRRTILRDIPVYAFYRTNIYIDVKKTRTMYNNDMIYGQIETLPIYDIMNDFDLENPELYLPTEIMKSIFSNYLPGGWGTDDESDMVSQSNVDTQLNNAIDKLANIELNISFKNKTGENMHLTTHHVVLKVNGKEVDSYKIRDPISILTLKPNEEVSLRAEANLGISKINGIYNATTHVLFDEIKSDQYIMWYETLGQVDKHLIFIKACNIMEKKLENLEAYIKSEHEEKKNGDLMTIKLNGEDGTIGNLMATVLQLSEHTKTAGFNTPHVNEQLVVIKYVNLLESKLKPLETFVEGIHYQVKLFKKIQSQFRKLVA